MTSRLEVFVDDCPAAAAALGWARHADNAADAMDRARSGTDFAAATQRFDAARQQLLNVLLDARKGADADTMAGMPDLLPVAAFLQERDPSLYGAYMDMLDMASDVGNGRATFSSAVEVHLYVYPDRGPLRALLAGLDQLRALPDFGALNEQLLTERVGQFRDDDFWIPQGTASLDALLRALQPQAEARATSSGGDAMATETEVRAQLATANWSWANVRDTLRLSNPDLLRRIIRFRATLTRALMNKARATVAGAAMTRYGDRFRWVIYEAPGSDRLTSDFDVSMRGTATELVVDAFNQLFRAWTLGKVDAFGQPRETGRDPVAAVELESAYVLDVNVYANDYLRGLGLRFLTNYAPDPDFWPHDKTMRAQAEAAQDLYALVKMRRYMTDREWTDFRGQLHAAVSEKRRGQVDALLEQANAQWTSFQETVKQREQVVRRQHAGMPDDNVRVRAENELYQETLNKLEAIRYNKGNAMDDAARLAFARMQGDAGVYGQEKYHTAGAVRDVVANSQQRQGVALSDVELLCSMNEQIGDLFKEIRHFIAAAPAADATPDVDFAVKSSKYMVRLGNAALALNQRLVNRLLVREVEAASAARRMFDTGAQTSLDEARMVDQIIGGLSSSVTAVTDELLALQSLCEFWGGTTARLLQIKDNEQDYRNPDRSWTEEALQRLRATPWLATAPGQARPVDALVAFVIGLAVAANAQFRNKTPTALAKRFLQEALASVLYLSRRAALAKLTRGKLRPPSASSFAPASDQT